MIENYRKAAVEAALRTKSAQNSFPFWLAEIECLLAGKFTGKGIFDLGDSLKRIFASSAQGQVRESIYSNANVSAGGAAWEALVCWYLNLCLVETSVVVIKSKKDLVPKFIADAISVKYNNFKSNTEADLIYIAFPNTFEASSKKTKESHAAYLDRLVLEGLSLKDLSIGIIQTKTNWNDNAQIPMLWDMVYAAKEFGRSVKVGSNGKSISSFSGFTYSFVTVPTQKSIESNFKVTSVCVNRVRYISGGNYWGCPSLDGVADSLKEFFQCNLKAHIPDSNIVANIEKALCSYNEKYSYFGLFNQKAPYYLTPQSP